MRKKMKKQVNSMCLLVHCKKPGNCETCGWHAHEARRRMTLPLVKGEDGMRRKYVGFNGGEL